MNTVLEKNTKLYKVLKGSTAKGTARLKVKKYEAKK